MTAISLRIDENLKADFQSVCSGLGMDMTTAVTVFMKQTVRQRKIPFEIALDPFYSEENMSLLRESIRRIEAGEATEHELFEVE